MNEVINIEGVSGDLLKQYIEQIERSEKEKADIMEHIREIYAAAKSDGLDPKIMRQIIKIRKMEDHDRDEQEALLEVYKKALGMSNEIDS